MLKCELEGCKYDEENINGCIFGYKGPLCNSCDTNGENWPKKFV